MVSQRFYLFLALLMFIMPAYCTINYAGTLTGSECRACKLKKRKK